MYAELHEYLFLNHELPLPGLGLIKARRHASVLDFPNRKIEGPGHSLEWKDDPSVNSQALAAWIAGNASINEHEARHQLEKFCFQLKNSLTGGDTIHWKGIGTLKMEKPGIIGFAADPMNRETAVTANKVIREKAEHLVKVGEEEKTSEQMTELLSRKKKGFKTWLLIAAILTIISIGFLSWYLNGHDWNFNAGNQAPAAISDPLGSGYKNYP